MPYLDEEDVFESDFASTDEEAVAEDIDAGDKAVQDEEKRVRRVRIIDMLY
jgi:vacuolar protein sorting-associated protein 72